MVVRVVVVVVAVVVVVVGVRGDGGGTHPQREGGKGPVVASKLSYAMV